MSFSDYNEGSATAEYNATIQDAREKIEQAKAKVSPEAQTRLDSLLARYTTNYASWTNKYNSNGASHVSMMISGPSNYNMRAHEKYLSRERTLWAEYDDIKDIDSKIWAIVNGDKIIKSDDANAIEKLQEKLAKELENHAALIAENKQLRKEGQEPHPAWMTSNGNGRIKGIRDRIAHLERLAEQAATTTIEEQTVEINGIKIIDNLEAQRLQIIFPNKPDANIREQLKKNGFRWSPTNGAWQRYRGHDAERLAKEIVSKLAGRKGGLDYEKRK
jgi:hypothetical protein